MGIEPHQVLLITAVEPEYDEPYRYTYGIGDGHDDAHTGHCGHAIEGNQEGETHQCHNGTDTDHTAMDPHVERRHIR